MTCPNCQHRMVAVYATHVLVCINCDETHDPYHPDRPAPSRPGEQRESTSIASAPASQVTGAQ